MCVATVFLSHTSSLLLGLHVDKTQRGIIYLDEVDKIARKQQGGSLSRDVSGEGVQQALLKMLEGSIIQVKDKSVPKQNPGGRPEFIEIDTSNILFVCGGAFSGLQDIIAKRTINSSIGFEATLSTYKSDSKDSARKDSELFEAVEPGDVVKYGLIPEFVGRFPLVVSTHALDIEQLIQVMTEPENSIYRQYRQMFAMNGIELVFSEDAFETIAVLATSRNTGARGLKSIVEQALLDVMFEVPSTHDVHTVYVNAETIQGTKPALVVCGDDKLENYLDNEEVEEESGTEATGWSCTGTARSQYM